MPHVFEYKDRFKRFTSANNNNNSLIIIIIIINNLRDKRQ
uniref:Uncharacterized protein n=1 Tax=Anguilla anguilla TaxID=7936 RepID=A0A0E9WAK7_ANGAN